MNTTIVVENILKLSHSLSQFTIGGEGNISGKIDGGFAIKASGKSLSTLTENEIVFCNPYGNKIRSNDLNPSMETKVHAWLLNLTNINYVAHTHPMNVLKIVCTDYINEFANYRLFPDQVVFNGRKSCIVEYGHPGENLHNNVMESVNKFLFFYGELPKVILLKNHGLISIGNTIDECSIISEMCEKSAEIFLGSKLLGSCIYLKEADIEMIVNDDKEKNRDNIICQK